MITQGLAKIIESSSNEINLFYKKIDEYFKGNMLKNLQKLPLNANDPKEVLKSLVSLIYDILRDLSFSEQEIECHFSSLWKSNIEDQLGNKKEIMEIYEILSPLLYKLFLDKIINYLADTKSNSHMAKLKSENFLPIEFIIKLKELRKFFNQNLEKKDRLQKYLQIQNKILQKLINNQENIEKFQQLNDPRDRIQLSYIMYRIIEFFNLEGMFDFSPIQDYIKEHPEQWLDTIPLVSLKNPDIYYCGIYLINKLIIPMDMNDVKYFLLNMYDECIDEFEAPLIEATNQVYFFFKSSWMARLELSNRQNKELLKGDKVYYTTSYLRNLETSQLVLILRVYNHLDLFDKLDQDKIKPITNEIERRVSEKGIKQFRDGFISAEATYHVLFYKYMRNSLEGLQTQKILDNIISRIYRNLQLIDFSEDINYDLLTELFYACQSLQLLNCIENESMVELLAKHLFPTRVLQKFIDSDETPTFNNSKLFELKISKDTGDLIHEIRH